MRRKPINFSFPWTTRQRPTDWPFIVACLLYFGALIFFGFIVPNL